MFRIDLSAIALKSSRSAERSRRSRSSRQSARSQNKNKKSIDELKNMETERQYQLFTFDETRNEE